LCLKLLKLLSMITCPQRRRKTAQKRRILHIECTSKVLSCVAVGADADAAAVAAVAVAVAVVDAVFSRYYGCRWSVCDMCRNFLVFFVWLFLSVFLFSLMCINRVPEASWRCLGPTDWRRL
jgi:hypothetical protein